jgi:hypothetical protein
LKRQSDDDILGLSIVLFEGEGIPSAHQVVGEEEIRLTLQAILHSETFARSQQLSRLLKYLCDALIAHGPDRISEYTIGTEALGRPADFDPSQDAAVRVEMHRLRRRIREYYAAEGSADTIRIDFPPGRYAPVVARAGEEHKESGVPVSAPPAQAMTVTPEPPNSAPPSRLPFRSLLWAAIAVAILAIPSATLPWRRSGRAIAGGRSETSTAAAAVAPAMASEAVRIGCGRDRPWTDRLGQIWGADRSFEGGEALEIPKRPYIAAAFDRHLFQSARTGNFSYRIPLQAQNYELRLYFIEPLFGPENDQGGEGNRLFSVSINGRKVLDRFDILADADGAWTADVRVFKDVSPGADGDLRLEFASISGAALLNAIELVPARPHVLNPVRLLPQDNFYTDSAGNLWTPDNYSRGGRVAIHPTQVTNTRDQEIFRHERYGRFRYAVPVDHGTYSVYLYMAEEYWGEGNPGGGGPGTRVFSVFCNNTPLLRSLDLIRDSGINYGVVRAFHHMTPNAQGKLVLAFEPEHDYASLYALELIDEAGPDKSSSERTVSSGGK